jgi:hypothetical protein
MNNGYLYISNRDRQPGQTADNFTVRANITGYYGFHIDKIIIPHTFYAFTENLNTKMFLEIDEIDQVFEIDIGEGNYNANDLALEIQNKFAPLIASVGSDGYTFLVAYELRRGKFTFELKSKAAGTPRVAGGFGAVAGRELGLAFSSEPGTQDGFLIIPEDVDGPVLTPFSPNLTGFDMINIYSEALMRHQTRIVSTSRGDNYLLTKVPNLVPYGETQYYQPSLNTIFHIPPYFNEPIDIKITNQYNFPIVFQGGEVLIKLKLYSSENISSI